MSDIPPEPIPPAGYLSRKALPIKRNDAEILTREDVQYDFLRYVFLDETAVFTPQTPASASRITFRELYVNALFHSNKCSKVLKDKMLETPEFGVELAKISLLTNVGRINTTMAFFPEMKTALRTYHPVPSLQKTDGNAQDAPRIKNCLKAALLPSEFKSTPPSTPEEILEKRVGLKASYKSKAEAYTQRAGQRPPTSIVNLIFVLSNHAVPLANVHFDGTVNFLDLFLPKALASPDRAKAFLWMIYHYLESDEPPNPFDAPNSRPIPGKAPYMRPLTHMELLRENVDTPEELEWGKRMSAQRNIFLQKLVTAMESEKKSKPAAPHFVTVAPQSLSTPDTPRTRSTRRHPEPSKENGPFMYYVPGEDPSMINKSDSPILPPLSPDSVAEMEGQRMLSIPTPVLANIPYFPELRFDGRSFLQHAWRSIHTSDALVESDEESVDGGDMRIDYSQRLSLISAIRGRPPTPEESTQIFQRSYPGRPKTFTRWQPVESWD